MKQKLSLALLLTLSTVVSVLADGETSSGNRSIIEYVYDSLGNVIDYIWG